MRLHIAQERLGRDAAAVRWIHADITSWSPDRVYYLWHDRAVLHFLTSDADQRHYRQIPNASSRPGTIDVQLCAELSLRSRHMRTR